MATKTKTVRVSEDELNAILEMREKALNPEPEAAPVTATITDSQQALADAFVSAIERTRPPEKKTIQTRKVNTPWTPKGEARLKLRRKMYHHGMVIGTKISNKEIELLNKIKPGSYCDNYVRVTVRKDRGLDVDYPCRTNSQRLKLINAYGIRSFAELLERIIDEQNNPSKYRRADDPNLYDIE
jgi:hypothetical protein